MFIGFILFRPRRSLIGRLTTSVAYDDLHFVVPYLLAAVIHDAAPSRLICYSSNGDQAIALLQQQKLLAG
jgi:hypothetical protein